MKIIHPHKVTGQLLDIIHEAEKELVIVSPYVNLRYWQKPVAAIQQAIARGVKVDARQHQFMSQPVAMISQHPLSQTTSLSNFI